MIYLKQRTINLNLLLRNVLHDTQNHILKKQELMNQWTPGYCCNFLPKIIKENIFEQDEGGLSQIIYLTPRWVIFIPSVTFEPLCTLNFMQYIRKNMTFTFRPFCFEPWAVF